MCTCPPGFCRNRNEDRQRNSQYIKVHISCEISTLDLTCVVTVKSTVEISQNFVTFSERTNFKIHEKKECSFRINVIAFYISRETFGFYTHFHSCLQDAQRKMFIDHKSRSHDNYKKSLFSSASFFNYGANHPYFHFCSPDFSQKIFFFLN